MWWSGGKAPNFMAGSAVPASTILQAATAGLLVGRIYVAAARTSQADGDWNGDIQIYVGPSSPPVNGYGRAGVGSRGTFASSAIRQNSTCVPVAAGEYYQWHYAESGAPSNNTISYAVTFIPLG